MNAPSVELAGVRGLPVPRYVLPNGEGTGYGLFKLDHASKTYFLNHLPEIGDAVTRGTAWITLWDDMLEGGVAPRSSSSWPCARCLKSVKSRTSNESLATLRTSTGDSCPTPERIAAASRLEKALLGGMRDCFRNVAEVGVLQRVSPYRRVTRRAGLPRAGVEPAGNDSRPGVRRDRLHQYGPGARAPECRLATEVILREQSAPDRESGSQGAIRVCHAGAIAGPGDPRHVLRRPRPRREPRARAVGS